MEITLLLKKRSKLIKNVTHSDSTDHKCKNVTTVTQQIITKIGWLIR